MKELEILCQKENCFSKHIGIYPEIENALKFIYHRLTGNFDDALGPLIESERTVILAKLVEGIETCSEGFYNRINDIITTFQLPKNLSQLLCQVRIELVKKIAARLTNEVHAWNSVTKIAALQGLGVPANCSEDQYPGKLSGIQIMEVLKQEFEGTFTPYCLSYLLVDQLRGLLAKVGYNGLRKEKSYVFGEVEMITETIKLYLSEDFKDTPYQEFFLIDEENFFIQDLNWTKIKEYFLLTLSNEKYFLKEATPDTICNLYDYACFINLYPIFDSKLEINPKFFDKNTAYFELQKIKTDFPLFWAKLKSHPILISKLKMLVDELIENRFLKAGIYEKIKILFSVNLDTIFEKTPFMIFFSS
ncbi:hypothetical protein [Rickettsiella massiliensis]|uniref:hypothetical protein n=1 Tax=Rickettsiella massiliensis TaxID=676517 RepID=UPI0012EAE3E3|nr:hypothetical protein [Rickettsiella massiliensis]